MRSSLSLVVLALSLSAASAHSDQPTGTIDCGPLIGLMDFAHLPAVQNPAPYARRIRFKMRNAESTCDVSGVTGGRAQITRVKVSFVGWLAAGSTCADLTGTPSFTKAKITANWAASNVTIGRSAAALASATYDPDAAQLVFVTQPIKAGAFAGSTLTFRLGFDQPGYSQHCETVFNGSYAGIGLAPPVLSTVSVP